MILKPVDAAFVLYDAGFRVGQGIVVALAVFRGESGLDTDAKNTAGNSPPSIDRGWVQLNSYWHSEVSDACAYDAACAAKEAFRISKEGTTFTSWAVYTSGVYKNYMELAWAAVDDMTRIKAEQARTIATQAQLAATQAQLASTQTSLDDCHAASALLEQRIVDLTADDASVAAQLAVAKDALSKALDDKAAAEAAAATMRVGLRAYLNSIEAAITGGPTGAA